MENNGAILLIEDDQDDVDVFSEIIKELNINHELICFKTIEQAFLHLRNEKQKPFIIICDNNWRNNNQSRLKHEIEKYAEGRLKSIPFIFFSASPEDRMINDAFGDLNVQGFFQKGTDYNTIKDDVSVILNYWERSMKPVF